MVYKIFRYHDVCIIDRVPAEWGEEVVAWSVRVTEQWCQPKPSDTQIPLNLGAYSAKLATAALTFSWYILSAAINLSIVYTVSHTKIPLSLFGNQKKRVYVDMQNQVKAMLNHFIDFCLNQLINDLIISWTLLWPKMTNSSTITL